MNNKIEDFGMKIGGARKDMYISLESLVMSMVDMTNAEKIKLIRKDKIWSLPDAKAQVEEGMTPFVAFWIREARKQVRQKPELYLRDVNKIDDIYELYIKGLYIIKDKIMAVKTIDDINSFYDYLNHIPDEDAHKVCAACSTYNLSRLRYMHRRMERKIEYDNFPYGNKKETKKERKQNFVPPQLKYIKRDGKTYRNGNINASVWQSKFAFRGVEFGNWMSQADRQVSMNYCYDAFMDLSEILKIEPKDIALDNSLSLAFGARGCSRAAAHYEPMRQVINLTKMHGAGSTAHEWFHAVDHYIALICGMNDGKLASEHYKGNNGLYPQTLVDLIKSCKFAENKSGYTEYYKNSIYFDKIFTKSGHNYWQSNCELLARAFSCYCKDKYSEVGIDDYLFAHSDIYTITTSYKEIINAFPEGEERKIINYRFDCLFNELKEMGIFHEKKEEISSPKAKETPIETIDFSDTLISIDASGQLKMNL